VSALPGCNGVIDISHHQRAVDWCAVREAGIVAVIHKASEGATFRDPAFGERRAGALAAGLLWGSYHYAGTAPAPDQVGNYLGHAAPGERDLVCLDYEAGPSGEVMSPGALLDFIRLVHACLGRRPMLYGGRLLALAAADLAAAGSGPVLASCPLWLARYGETPPAVPPPWSRWTLWQYTDGADGPEPRTVPGIGPCDRNIFSGTREELLAAWPFGAEI
jgi:lysozyme